MDVKGKRIGVGITGSFCTYERAFAALRELTDAGAAVQTVFSAAAGATDSRFGDSEGFCRTAEEITGRKPWYTIPEVEPVGPKALWDMLIILPCTGNTLAKLANGITDGAVLMAAKAHMRNERPVLLSISTNDALGMNMKNIGLLLNAKHIFFVPFGQDNPVKKPASMIARTELLLPAAEAALEGRQYQPILFGPPETV